MKPLLIFAFVFMGAYCMADCLACFELRKVEIITNDGLKKTGYVYWNEAWLSGEMQQWANKFPQSLIALYKTMPERPIQLIKKIYTVKNDSLFEFKVTTQEDISEVTVNQIKEIREIDKEAKKYQGVFSLDIYTLHEIKLLNTNPFATYRTEDAAGEYYYLSYSKDIDRKQLQRIEEKKYPERDIELKKNKGIIRVVVGYD